MPSGLRDELREEWMLLQKQYEDFDNRALTIKSLATPLLGLGYAQGVNGESLALVSATIMVAGCLWALETLWKTFQYCLTDRIIALESYFRSPEHKDDFRPYQIFTSWGQVFERDKGNLKLLRQRAMQPFVLLPYAPMMLAGIVIIVAMSLTANLDVSK